MLKHWQMVAKIGVDTTENEPSEVLVEKSEKSSVSNFPSKEQPPAGCTRELAAEQAAVGAEHTDASRAENTSC